MATEATKSQLENRIFELEDIISRTEQIKKEYITQKNSAEKVMAVMIRTSTKSVTFNSNLETTIYDKIVNDFIDSLIPKMDEEITIITTELNKVKSDLEALNKLNNNPE